MNAYYIGSALNLSALYMIAGSGAAVSIKSGDFNLGGEGQIYLGGFISAVILGFGTKIALLPAPIAVFLAISAAFLLTAVIALISALLKIFRRADFLFTSFITSAALIPFIDGLIAGPARSKTDNLLATPFIGAAVRLKQLLPPSPLNTSFILAIALCAGLWLALNRTSWGRQLCVLGISPDFARYAGYDRRALGCGAAVISGGLHGLCGAAAILGTYFSCHQGFYSGIGWNAFSAALIARANPIFLIPSSLFLGFITTYANKFAMYHNFGFDISSLIQAVVMFIIAFPLVRKNGDKTL